MSENKEQLLIRYNNQNYILVVTAPLQRENLSCLQQDNRTSNTTRHSAFCTLTIITSVPSTVTTGMTLVWPEGPTKLITLWKPIHILQLPPACSATSPYFYLPPHYAAITATINISLEIANLNMVNKSVLDFHIWQHLENHQNETQLQHLASIPPVPLNQLYKHMISGTNPITPFTSPEESTGDTVLIWTLFSHIGVYVMAIR